MSKTTLSERLHSIASANIESGTELGVSFCALKEGEVLAEFHTGYIDRKKETPWTEDTISCVYSSGKAVTSLLVAKAVSDGMLDYKAPIANIWPEFAASGKEGVTLEQVLSHQEGLCGFPDEMPPEEWLDWDLICARLAAMSPLWEVGSASGYHPQTFGLIVGEVLKRATGHPIGEHLRQMNAGIYCGLQDNEIDRTAFMPRPPRAPDLGTITDLKQIAFLKPWSAPARVSRDEWLAAELPASNMHTNAKSLATFLHPFANNGIGFDGQRFCSDAAINDALTVRISGDDLVLPFNLTWAAGLMANTQGHFGPSKTAFGHAGFGGSCIVVDPANGLVVAYVMNKMSEHLVGDPRAVALINEVYASLD